MSAWASAKARRVFAAMKRIGWRHDRTVGSHKIMKKDGWADYPFSFHDSEELGPAVLAKISKRPAFNPEICDVRPRFPQVFWEAEGDDAPKTSWRFERPITVTKATRNRSSSAQLNANAPGSPGPRPASASESTSYANMKSPNIRWETGNTRQPPLQAKLRIPAGWVIRENPSCHPSHVQPP